AGCMAGTGSPAGVAAAPSAGSSSSSGRPGSVPAASAERCRTGSRGRRNRRSALSSGRMAATRGRGLPGRPVRRNPCARVGSTSFRPGPRAPREDLKLMGAIGEQIAAYGGWRGELADAIRRYGLWLDDVGLADGVGPARNGAMAARLAGARVTGAFVAEFSRGKSELINAIFFPDHGQRVVPSSAGRTTMCPTELRWDADRPPSVRLLPVETRIDDTPLAELRQHPEAWTEILLPQGDPGRLRQAFSAVQEVERVPLDRARQLGFVEEGDDGLLQPDAEGLVQVPRWRHAIGNWPHPLLEMGLVIIDTPGLNAIGAEPELTLSMIPRADAVLFVLAADTGVTRSDIEVWRRHVSPVQRSGRIAVLNKIDGLWDELRDEASVEAEIDRQVANVAATLDLPAGMVFPVSAQKGLVARVQGDRDLLRRSRLPALEWALAVELVPRQRELLVEHVRREF